MTKPVTLVFALSIFVAGCSGVEQRPSDSATARQLQINGVDLNYVEQGTGTPVVLIHGAIQDNRFWDSQREVVARKYRAIALNLRYHGSAPWPDEGKNYSAATHAADLVDFVRALNAGPVHLVGRSYGGNVVAIVALQHPELVRSVVLVEPLTASLIAGPEAKAVLNERNQSFGLIRAAAKNGDSTKATVLLSEWSNNQGPGSFELQSQASRSMALDNARTLPLLLAAPPPPPVYYAAPTAIINGYPAYLGQDGQWYYR